MPIDARILLPWPGRTPQTAGQAVAWPAQTSAAAWFIVRSQRRSADPPAWREWIMAGTGLDDEVLQRFPAGPCLSASNAPSVLTGCVACVQPVHLQTATDHLQLAELGSLALSEADARAILDTLNPYLSNYSMRLLYVEPMLWLLHSERAVRCETTEPVEAVGRNLRDYLPRGLDAAWLNRLLTELQMILHEHPVNIMRRERGQCVVNALWPWGFGPAGGAGPAACVLPQLHTDDPWLRGLWALHGGASTGLERLRDGSIDMHKDFTFAWHVPPHRDHQQWLELLEGSVFAPLKKVLRKRSAGRILLRLGTTEFEFAGLYAWRPWRRRRQINELFE